MPPDVNDDASSSGRTSFLRGMRCSRLIRETAGTATVEFVVLLTCIAVGGILMWQFMGKTIVSIISGD
jgi:Flp pilus assembly pilin Flp